MKWQRELTNVWSAVGSSLFSAADLWKATHAVPHTSFRMLCGICDRLGEELARSQVPGGQIVITTNALTEIALPYFARDKPESALAFARISSVACQLVLVSYTSYGDRHVKTLQTQLEESAKRLHDASAYVTHVYEEERRQLSRDLHDDIGHDLVVLKLHLELLATDLERQKLDELRHRLAEARTLVTHSIDSVRRLVLDLGPKVFEDLGFLPALRYYARRFSVSTSIEVSIQADRLTGDPPLSHQTAIYRVLQGALSNVLKHARAKHVKVGLASLKDAVLVMTIEDDGVGFDPNNVPGGRNFGLTAIKERIAVLGGKVQFNSWLASAPGRRHGTRIEVDLPLPRIA